MRKSTILWTLALTLLCQCGIFSKKKDKPAPQAPPPPVFDLNANYLSFDQIMTELRATDQVEDDENPMETAIRRTWLWQNLFGIMAGLSVEQRNQLDEYLESRKTSSNLSGLLDFDPAPPKSERFSFSLPANQSIRIPVTSFCLHGSRSSPSGDLRYRMTSLETETLSRQILFKYLLTQENDEDFQSLMWSLEREESEIRSLGKFPEILTEMGIPFRPEMTLAEFNNDPAARQKANTLGVGQSYQSDALQFSLTSSGYSRGMLNIYNPSQSAIAIDEQTLNVRMEPQSTPSEDVEVEDYQSIYVSGADPSSVSTNQSQEEARASQVNGINRRIDDLIASGQLSENDQSALDMSRKIGADLMAQGEVGLGQSIYNSALDLLPDLESGMDLATAITPGVNDIRDAYEFFRGEDLITGRPLALWERALAGVGLIAGSGTAFRTGIDSLTRSTNVGSDIYRNADEIVAKVGKNGTNGQTVFGHYPEYMNEANELGARRFEIPTEQWDRMSASEQWASNKRFLERTISRGDEILLATPAHKARPGSFYKKELDYFKSKGYTVSDNGRKLNPPNP